MPWHGRTVLGSACALAAVSAASTALADCTCRFGGRDFELGTTVCLPTPAGSRLATCDMVVNNTSWRFSAAPCPAAKAAPPPVKRDIASRKRYMAAFERRRPAP
jgi:hypothetical protein